MKEFKVWNIEEKEFLEESKFVIFDGDVYEMYHSCSPATDEWNSEMAEEPMENIELLQSLGRTDRFDKKLFEGDIIKHWEYGRDDDVTDGVPEILLIESLEGFFKHVGYTGRELGEEWASKDIEITGNKFMDPEKVPKEEAWLE